MVCKRIYGCGQVDKISQFCYLFIYIYIYVNYCTSQLYRISPRKEVPSAFLN